jgi:ppGpp synthetase/RelA/SpoT-type nucleotidyltranferase
VKKARTTAIAAPAAATPKASAVEEEEIPFDFAAHRQHAIDEYQPLRELFSDYALAVYSILKARLERDNVKVNSLEHRAKSVESLGDKAEKASEEDPNRPRYSDPLTDITDLAGVRVITHFLSTEQLVDRIIEDEFEVVEKSDRAALLRLEERLGYQSIHYLVSLRENRQLLPEYRRFANLPAEIQVRTVLQHAWAEIEHDIQYKAQTALPSEIRRRFMTLAGLLEIGDREFQQIQDESERLATEAQESLAAGRLDVEITPAALKTYLDNRLGTDGRMRDWSYQYEAGLLRRLGFTDLQQLDDAMAAYDDDAVSRIAHGSRQGQLTRLDDVLLAAMGDEYIRRHPWVRADESWYREILESRLTRLRDADIPIGSFRPNPPAEPLGS